MSVNIDFHSRSGKKSASASVVSKSVTKEELPSLEDKLKFAEDTLQNIAKEVEFARNQELLLKEAGGNSVTCFFMCYAQHYIIENICFCSYVFVDE